MLHEARPSALEQESAFSVSPSALPDEELITLAAGLATLATRQHELQVKHDVLAAAYQQEAYQVARFASRVIKGMPFLKSLTRTFFLPAAKAGWRAIKRTRPAMGTQTSDIRALDTIIPGQPQSRHTLLTTLGQGDPVTYPNRDQWYTTDDPQVSIIILNHKQAELTIRCIKEIWKHTTGYNYEIIVVDNGSHTSDVLKLMRFPGPFTLVPLTQNRFLGEGYNIGAERARGNYLVFLHQDAFVTPQWLAPILATFEEQDDAGIVGPMLVHPDGTLQEVGGVIAHDGSSHQLGHNQDANDPHYRVRRTVDYCSAVAMTVRRDLFLRVYGFDPCWEPASYADTDLCFKIRALGAKVYYCPHAKVVHSAHAPPHETSHDQVDINKAKFVRRWQSAFGQADITHASQAINAAFRPSTSPSLTLSPKRTAGVYTPFTLTPGGGTKYILTLAEYLSQSHTTYLILDEIYSTLHLKHLGEDLDLNLDQLSIVTLAEAARMAPFDVFVAMSNEIVPPVRALGQRSFYHCQFPFPCDDDILISRRAYWNGYQSLIVNSAFSRTFVDGHRRWNQLPAKPIDILYPPCFSIEEQAVAPNFDGAGTPSETVSATLSILSVGRFFVRGHCKQHDIMITAFRDLVARLPQGTAIALHLAGTLPPSQEDRAYFLQLQQQAEGLPITFHCNAEATELRDLARAATFYWHATGILADPEKHPEQLEHFGMAIVAAMAQGCVPIVPGKGGPVEIVTHEVDGILYQSPQELTQATYDLWGDAPRLARLRVAASKRSLAFSKEQFAVRLEEVLAQTPHLLAAFQ